MSDPVAMPPGERRSSAYWARLVKILTAIFDIFASSSVFGMQLLDLPMWLFVVAGDARNTSLPSP